MATLPDPRRPDLYVGYLPTPPRHRRFLRALIPSLILLLAISATLIARAQRDPGAGVWNTDAGVTVEGPLRTNPYPHIVTASQRVLLVESGKFGARERAQPLDGRTVRAAGYPLTRDGRTVLELVPGAEALIDTGAPTRLPTPMQGGENVTLIGEIVDSKCYHGAMKPGDGKGHKACAILCIRGGIPPVLMIRSHDAASEAILLAALDGGPVGDWLLPFVGEPVQITGALTASTEGRTLRIGEGAVRLR